MISVSAWAWPPTYGAEFELYHPSMRTDGEADPTDPALGAAKLLYVNNIRKICEQRGCVVEAVRGKWWNMPEKEMANDYRVTMPDGWWFKISHDPLCLEITTKPSTLAELKQHRAVIDEMIFDSGKPLGFRVPPSDTAHFNIGIDSAFEGDAKEFLRFFVDYQNHPELAQGVLGQDFNNAPSLAVLGEEQRLALKKIVNDVNSGMKDFSLGSLAETITSKVYTRSYNPSWGGANHYQAIGLKYVSAYGLKGGDRPMEIRAMWNQKDAEHFIKIAELIEARIAFLNKQNTKIKYGGTKLQNFTDIEKKTRFYFYVTESGLPFARYNELLPYSLRNVAFDTLLDEKASMSERLKNLENYRDVLAFSPGLRAYAQELIRRAKQSHRKFDLSILQDLARASRVTPVSCELVHVK